MSSPGHRRIPAGPQLGQIMVGALAACLLLFLGATPANAQGNEGLEVSSSIIYAPDPALEQIAVTATYTMTNRQTDEVIGDSVRSFFYTTWVIAMPATATNFAASSTGQSLVATIETDPDSDTVVFGTITLPFNLSYEQTVQLDVSFTIPGSEPRTGGTVARVNDSFLSFSVWAAGDPGRTDVRIIVPDGFSVDLQGDLDELREVTTANGTIFEAIGIQQPQDFFGQFFGRNDSGLLTATASLPGATATIRAWPDDPEWADFVVQAIEDDVPIIEDLTGLDWPAGDIEVIETVTPYLFGYGGWFNASSGLIEIGDHLERDLILHELSHAWFNDELIDGRWITEGMAEEFASRAIEASGDEITHPTIPDLEDPLRVPLAEWASPWTLDEADAFGYEQYHYNASWWVIRQITDEIGLEAFSEVLLALRNDDLPYFGEGPAEQTTQSTRWTHMYDLLEDRGATELDNLFRIYVLPDADLNRLDLRRVARDEYDTLLDAGNEWSPPLVLRQAMTAWRFDDARPLIQTSLDVVERRDQVDALADELAITGDRPIEVAYEIALSTSDLDQAAKDMNQALAQLKAVDGARVDLVQQAAMLNTTVEFESMSYDDAITDIANQQRAIDTVAGLRTQVYDAANELDLVAPNWPQSTGPTDFDAAAALAEARLATLTAISKTASAVDAPRGLLQNIGLVRSDPDRLLAQARTAFQADELDDALGATAAAAAVIDNAASKGRTRVIWGAAVFLFVVLTTLAIAWSQRRRPRAAKLIDVREAAATEPDSSAVSR